MKILPSVSLALLGLLLLSPERTHALKLQDGKDIKTTADKQAPAQTGKKGYIGLWQGTLRFPGGALRLVLDIQPESNKPPAGTKQAYTATLRSPDQTPNPIPVDKIEIMDGMLRLESKGIGAHYEGKFNKDVTEIVGTFRQGTGALPLTLKKVDEIQAAAKVVEKPKPQEPTRPYPYDEEEVKVENKLQNVTLAGTLTLPRAKGPFPAVLLITGSGPQDRNEALLGHKPFLVLSDYLTRRGIAVLRVDDRGVGKSTGTFGAATTADFATDVLAGVTYLKTRKEIVPAKIGLIGHSEGGVIAPLVASQSRDVAFIVMMAGTGVPGDQILMRQDELIEKAGGASEEAIARNRNVQKRMFEVVRTEQDAARRKQKLHEIGDDIKKHLTPSEKKAMGDPDAFINAQIAAIEAPWMRYFLIYDPRPALHKVTCPVLALNGEHDLQVQPKQNLPEIEAALKAGGNKSYTIKELPGLNHLFQTSKTGAPSEYAQIDETIAPLALQTMGDWIVQHTHPAPK